jgi:hypothetical protein
MSSNSHGTKLAPPIRILSPEAKQGLNTLR